MNESADTSASTVTSDEDGRASDLMRRLDAWKTRIDELRVQIDLAKLDVREEAVKQLDLARNVNHVAASQLRVAYEDAADTAELLRQGVLELLHDVDNAFDAVNAVIARED